MSKAFHDLAAVREEMSALYRSAKQGTLLLPHAKELTGILKAIAAVIRDEKEMDIEAELNAIREQIAAMKGDVNAQMES